VTYHRITDNVEHSSVDAEAAEKCHENLALIL
jgi:hypothetical protein